MLSKAGTPIVDRVGLGRARPAIRFAKPTPGSRPTALSGLCVSAVTLNVFEVARIQL